ncbi:zinc ABC transporter substrate-binding protein [Mariniblastus sp.]|nr:zinc ABC transporter substrate-binding protein [Mariniblastus sp.]
MINTRRFIQSVVLALATAIVSTTCQPLSAVAAEDETQDSKPKLSVVCSTTQIADFARQVVGDRWKVICVLAPGEDPHTYETGNDDLIAVSKADLCLENGWHLEGNEWMQGLASSANKPVVTCVNGVEALMLEEANESGQPETIKDPHAWFDHNNAAVYVKNIRDAVSKVDPDNAEEYAARASLYMLQLRGLGRWIERQVNVIPKNRRILVTHHDAFGYFCRTYGFKSVTPVGWTTGELTDVSLEDRQAVIKQIQELGVKSIFVETTINTELLEGIARDAGITIGGSLYSDAMGSEGTAGDTFIGMMRENVLIIVEHLK